MGEGEGNAGGELSRHGELELELEWRLNVDERGQERGKETTIPSTPNYFDSLKSGYPNSPRLLFHFLLF